MDKSEAFIDFNSICRLCMTEEALMCPIFNEQIGVVPLSLRIMACVSIEITPSDGLPPSICNTCYQQIDTWYKFRDLCENTDTTLRKLIASEPVDYGIVTQIQKTAEDVKKYFTGVPYRQDSCQEPTTSLQGETYKTETDLSLKREADGHCTVDVVEIGYVDNTMGDEQDGFSSEDDLNLLVTKVKLLGKKKKDVVEGSVRTVCTQTEDDECDDVGFEEICFGQMPKKGVKKAKNKKTQTFEGEDEQKKPLRTRPAVPSACTLCDKVYKNREILRQHMKSHHVNGEIECQHCQMKFASVRSLKYHEQRKHSNLEPVPCSVCGKKFLDKKYLRVHENIHSQSNLYVCHFCGRNFIMKTNLTVHISRHHTQKSNDFICQVCGKAFPFKLYLKKHFMTHTDFKPHACTYCDAKFRENTLLRKHINSIHLKLRPYSCQYCRKTFTRNSYMREHMESQHLGIPKKVECGRCGDTFRNRSRLRQHECEGEVP